MIDARVALDHRTALERGPNNGARGVGASRKLHTCAIANDPGAVHFRPRQGSVDSVDARRQLDETARIPCRLEGRLVVMHGIAPCEHAVGGTSRQIDTRYGPRSRHHTLQSCRSAPPMNGAAGELASITPEN